MQPDQHSIGPRQIFRNTRSEEETVELGRWIGTMLQPGDHVYLHGELGTGKTRLAKGIIAQYAGIHPDDVVSPTFTLLNRYGEVHEIFHADLYRIEWPDVEDIGLEIVSETDSVLVLEWPEKMRDLHHASLRVTLSYGQGEDERSISLEWMTQSLWDDRMQQQQDKIELMNRDSRICSVPQIDQSDDGEYACRS